MNKNPYYLLKFSNYFIKQWAPIIPLVTATIIRFVKNQDVFENNQTAEPYFRVLKNNTMSQYQLENKY